MDTDITTNPGKAKVAALIIIALSVLGLSPSVAESAADKPAGTPAIFSSQARFHPVLARRGMVASQEAQATRIGVDILKHGGNAVDAAVAVGFALAVTLPRAGNLGGGGFMLIHMAGSGQTQALDYREMAPKSAHRDMYIGSDGDVDKRKARFSHHSVGVPGTVAGLVAAQERFGSMTLSAVMEPAIALARDGIEVTPGLSRALKRAAKRLRRWPTTTAIFYKTDGGYYEAGDTLVQSDLAHSLILIANEGAQAFYGGAIAKALVAEMTAHSGPITLADLAAYRPKWREPVRGRYRGHDIASMPPPSSGGIHLLQMLNILEGYDLKETGMGSAETGHLMVETMRLAYADRAVHLGDPDFWNVPSRGLTSTAYAAHLRARIDPARARPSSEVEAGHPAPFESEETTHYSVIDKDGNAVSNTYTLNFSYGTGIVANGTGILLNNEMDDFSAKPGVANAYGLIGGEANAIAPGKRPLSSMTPTIVFRDGKPYLVTGTPGGSRIITTVLQIISNVIDHGRNIAEATAAPRLHHQWQPDKLYVEHGVNPDTIRLLKDKGHDVVERRAMGSVQSVMRLRDGENVILAGASDPRRSGALTAGH